MQALYEYTVGGVPSLWLAFKRSNILQAVQQYMDTNTHAAEVRTTNMVTRWRNIVFHKHHLENFIFC